MIINLGFILVTRSQLICGCTGFFIGAVLGYSYAILSNRSLIIVSQMHGAVCPNYRGTQVRINQLINYI